MLTGAVRSHYGHPDLWNRLFTMTRGGVSKANAVQHVSEVSKEQPHYDYHIRQLLRSA